MKDLVKILDDISAPLSLWEDVAATCRYATYFHTPEWADIFCRYSQGRIRPSPRLLIFEDDVCAIVPLCLKDFFGGAYQLYLSSTAGTFGGWISRDRLSAGHTRALIDYMLKMDNITWRENPYDPLLGSLEIAGAADDFTQVIDLTQNEHELQNAVSRAHAKALRKATREGVVIYETDSMADWEQHFRAYESSLIRWKKAGTVKKLYKPYTWDIFKIIIEKKSPHCKLWCARYKGLIVASVLCFYWNSHAVAWHGSALEEFFSVRPNNLLYQHMIDHARKSGYHWFDCNPAGQHGVVDFKDNLGTQRRKARFLDKASKERKILQTLRKIF
jgi:hypothetical protein